MILVDIDGTIAATGELLLRRFGVPVERYPATLPGKFWRSREGFEVYRDVEPITGSIEALHVISQAHSIVYNTARLPESKFITVRWLRKHGFPLGEVRFCKNLEEKARLSVGAAFVFDDDPNAPFFYQETCLILIARPYNKGVARYRFTWEEMLRGGVFDCSRRPL